MRVVIILLSNIIFWGNLIAQTSSNTSLTYKGDSVLVGNIWMHKEYFAKNYYLTDGKKVDDSVYYHKKWIHKDDYERVRNLYHGKTLNDSVYDGHKWIHKNLYKKFNYETYYMPGATYSVYMPKKRDSSGVFSGVGIDYLLYAKAKQTDDFGPSHVKVYTKLGLFKSSKPDISNLFVYNLGLQMSVERNPRRIFMIPYFGAEAGGMTHKQLKTSFSIQPLLGVYVISTKNVFINIHGGYNYTMDNNEYLNGYFVNSSLNFALW